MTIFTTAPTNAHLTNAWENITEVLVEAGLYFLIAGEKKAAR